MKIQNQNAQKTKPKICVGNLIELEIMARVGPSSKLNRNRIEKNDMTVLRAMERELLDGMDGAFLAVELGALGAL
jgi:hypothetical protein